MGLKRAIGYAAASAALIAFAACGSDDDARNEAGEAMVAADVERIEVDTHSSEPDWFDPIALGDVLLTDFAGTPLMSSTDLGATWEDVNLPDFPTHFQPNNYMSLEVIEGVAVVSGTGGAENPFDASPHVWTSANGLDWQGGKISDGQLDRIHVTGLDGVLYVSLTTSTTSSNAITPFELLRSDNGGASWSPTQLATGFLPGDAVESGGDVWRDDKGQLIIPVYNTSTRASRAERPQRVRLRHS